MIKTETNLTGILRWPTRRAKEWVQDFLTRVENEKNVLAVIALGSCVRPNVSSLDLDIVVICQKPAVLRYRAPMEIDLRKFEAGKIHDDIASGNDLLGWCIKFGVALFERSRFWTTTVEEWSNRVPLPSADAARERAQVAKQRMQELWQVGDTNAALEMEVSYYTHLARAALIEHGVYPASRPELSFQLRSIGELQLADDFKTVFERYRSEMC